MKNRKSHQMFLDEKNLAILIITRATHRLLILSLACAQLVFLFGTSNLPVTAQPAHNDALNVREHIYKGNSLMQRRDYEGAIAEYEQALLIDSTSTTAKDNIVLTHNNWGIDLFHQKKYDEAREQWNTALKLNPYDRNAKNNLNVLRVQMTKLGLPPNGPATNPAGKAASDDAKFGGAVLPRGAQTAKEDTTPVPNAVIIGRPLSTSTQASFSGTTESLPASSTAGSGSGAAGSSGSSGAVVIMKPATSSSSSFSNPPTSSNIPSAFSAQPGNASGAQAINMSAPSASNTSSSLNSSNIEDKLAALENKVYGRSSKEVPILQRLERLERDTSSRPSLGSINDRVQTLIKTYGL